MLKLQPQHANFSHQEMKYTLNAMNYERLFYSVIPKGFTATIIINIGEISTIEAFDIVQFGLLASAY